MQRKIIMVDVDGVVITHPSPMGWSAGLQRDLGISAKDIQERFFRIHWLDIVHGRAKLRDCLASVLAELEPRVTCDAFIDYWFKNDAHINRSLVREFANLRSDRVEVHLATVREHERADYIWETLDLKASFDQLHYFAAIGHSKPAFEFYRIIQREVGLGADCIFFVDDKPENIEGARNCGWNAALWTGEKGFAELAASLGWNVS